MKKSYSIIAILLSLMFSSYKAVADDLDLDDAAVEEAFENEPVPEQLPPAAASTSTDGSDEAISVSDEQVKPEAPKAVQKNIRKEKMKAKAQKKNKANKKFAKKAKKAKKKNKKRS